MNNEEPHPLAGLHINQGSADAVADAYEVEYVKAKSEEDYLNYYHKIKAEVDLNLWRKIWAKGWMKAQATIAELRSTHAEEYANKVISSALGTQSKEEKRE